MKFFKINKKMIINISSDVSLRGSFNYPAYASSKAAIDNTTKSFSKIFSDTFFLFFTFATNCKFEKFKE